MQCQCRISTLEIVDVLYRCVYVCDFLSGNNRFGMFFVVIVAATALMVVIHFIGEMRRMQLMNYDVFLLCQRL